MNWSGFGEFETSGEIVFCCAQLVDLPFSHEVAAAISRRREPTDRDDPNFMSREAALARVQRGTLSSRFMELLSPLLFA